MVLAVLLFGDAMKVSVGLASFNAHCRSDKVHLVDDDPDTRRGYLPVVRHGGEHDSAQVGYMSYRKAMVRVAACGASVTFVKHNVSDSIINCKRCKKIMEEGD